MAFSNAFNPSAFSGVDVVITENQIDFVKSPSKQKRIQKRRKVTKNQLPYNGGAMRLILIGNSSVDVSNPARNASLTASIPSYS